MKIIEQIKNILKHKIEINIITPPPSGVKVSYTPTEIERPILVKKSHSNFRFVESQREETDGSVKTYYYTEEFAHNRWGFVHNSFFADKDKAMEAHIKLIEEGEAALEPKKVETILWEGLSKDEAKFWVGVQKENVIQ